ncbi:MAG TPA: hypothetical protein DCS04_05640 [Ruminococcaceae bacterium]|nr:hypothetical protein [Oscillospiraceae bacterium]
MYCKVSRNQLGAPLGEQEKLAETIMGAILVELSAQPTEGFVKSLMKSCFNLLCNGGKRCRQKL